MVFVCSCSILVDDAMSMMRSCEQRFTSKCSWCRAKADLAVSLEYVTAASDSAILHQGSPPA